MINHHRRRTVGLLSAILLMTLVLGCSDQGGLDVLAPDRTADQLTHGSEPELDPTAADKSAGIPTEGTVVEGVSVPGVALGDTRLDVYASWGMPYSCTGPDAYGYSRCQFGSPYIGWAWVYFQAPEGREDTENPDDVATRIMWGEGFPGWFTTEGINTTIAEYDVDQLISAYPDAVLTYYQYSWYPDYLFSLTEYTRGFRVERPWNFYGGNASIFMSIFAPTDGPPDPPDPPDLIRVTDVTLTAEKVRGKRNIVGSIQLETSTGHSGEGAAVSAYWALPDGSNIELQGTAGGDGSLSFTLTNAAKKGTHYLFVTDVALEGFVYDRYGSVTYGSLDGR
jgi:hypothetical protein